MKNLFSGSSVRLNTLVVIEIVTLLLVSLGVLFYFTRKSLVEEARKDAVLRLDGMVQNVDNILLSVEQSAGNVYFEMQNHLDQPDRLMYYCRRMVECNSNIVGCVIAMKPGYYPDKDSFMAFVHRKKFNSPELVSTDKAINQPYPKQFWFTETMKTGKALWLDPGQNNDYKIEPIIAFCLPIRDGSKECVGVMSVGLSVNLLSQIVLENKPTPSGYSLLLSHEGLYIIHPNREKLAGQNAFKLPDIVNSPTAKAAAKAITSGKNGEVSFDLNDHTWYAFYRPFVRNDVAGRSMEELNWSIASIYLKEDIFGEYNHLVFYVLVVAMIGLLVFYVLCRSSIRKQTKPLSYLTVSAERIAAGHYDESIPDTNRDDEIGVFQQHFQIMQKALAADVSKQETLQSMLNERREEIQKVQQQIDENDQVKATFLHNVTNRMIEPSHKILDSVTKLCDSYQTITLQEADKEIDEIKKQSDVILQLLSHKFDPVVSHGLRTRTKASSSEAGKEDSHE